MGKFGFPTLVEVSHPFHLPWKSHSEVVPMSMYGEIWSVALATFKSKLVSSVLVNWPVIEQLGKAGGTEERRRGK